MVSLNYIAGFIWCFPATLLGLIFFVIPNLFKDTFCDIWIDRHLCITFEVDQHSKFYDNAMEGWFGFVIGSLRVVIDIDLPTRELGILDVAEVHKDHPQYKKMRHEFRHVMQNYVFGVFFYPVYIIITCYIWLFRKDLHSYLDNPFERDARRFANQRVHVPKEDWPDGPADRFPWA